MHPNPFTVHVYSAECVRHNDVHVCAMVLIELSWPSAIVASGMHLGAPRVRTWSGNRKMHWPGVKLVILATEHDFISNWQVWIEGVGIGVEYLKKRNPSSARLRASAEMKHCAFFRMVLNVTQP